MIVEMLLPGHQQELKVLKVQENQHLMLLKLQPIHAATKAQEHGFKKL